MSDSSYELQRLVTIGTFSTPWEAQIAQARLSAEGLHSLIADEHVIRMVALSNAVGGVQLKVREQDADAAIEVLRRLAPLPEIYLVAAGTAGAGADAPADPEPAGGGSPDPAAPAGAPVAVLAAPQAADGPHAESESSEGDASPDAGPQGAGARRARPPGRACPACGSADLQPERSSRLLLGMLPVSRRGFRCGACGILWGAEEIRGDAGQARPSADLAGTADDDSRQIDLHTVARFHTPWEAHLARTFLESEGLRSCVLEERLPAVHLLSAEPVAYNRLEVRRADAGRAAAILARAWSGQLAAAASEDEDGDAGASALHGERPARRRVSDPHDPRRDRDPREPADPPVRREPEEVPEEGPPVAQPPIDDPLDAPGSGEPAWRDPAPGDLPRRDP